MHVFLSALKTNRFVSNVDAMLTSLSHNSLSFIRCFKPNDCRSPSVFDGAVVARQVREEGSVTATKLLYGFPLLKNFVDSTIIGFNDASQIFVLDTIFSLFASLGFHMLVATIVSCRFF